MQSQNLSKHYTVNKHLDVVCQQPEEERLVAILQLHEEQVLGDDIFGASEAAIVVAGSARAVVRIVHALQLVLERKLRRGQQTAETQSITLARRKRRRFVVLTARPCDSEHLSITSRPVLTKGSCRISAPVRSAGSCNGRTVLLLNAKQRAAFTVGERRAARSARGLTRPSIFCCWPSKRRVRLRPRNCNFFQSVNVIHFHSANTDSYLQPLS